MYPDVRVVLDYNGEFKLLVGSRALYTFSIKCYADEIAMVIRRSYRELFQ